MGVVLFRLSQASVRIRAATTFCVLCSATGRHDGGDRRVQRPLAGSCRRKVKGWQQSVDQVEKRHASRPLASFCGSAANFSVLDEQWRKQQRSYDTSIDGLQEEVLQFSRRALEGTRLVLAHHEE